MDDLLGTLRLKGIVAMQESRRALGTWQKPTSSLDIDVELCRRCTYDRSQRGLTGPWNIILHIN